MNPQTNFLSGLLQTLASLFGLTVNSPVVNCRYKLVAGTWTLVCD